MMGKAARLKMVDPVTSPEKPKQSIDPFPWLEERPRPEWFLKMRSAQGQMSWFVRFTMTGRQARLYGPFANKKTCLMFLNDALERLLNDGRSEIEISQNELRLWPGKFEAEDGPYPILESTLATHAKRLQRQKGR